EEHLVFICGHYEGYDERIREHLVTDELSIGDYVLTGGELAAITMTDAIVRLIPESIKEESHKDDSFSTGLLEHPQYTRPAEYNGMKVPEVLLSGNHKRIDSWRHEMRLKRTFERRPDLLAHYPLTQSDEDYLEQLKLNN
ncbi:MAG: tRNA (guanosine(37)-N1)-methyltransferase TrmD, partial [Macrococcus canis]|nr:tRNA (guanosine(37)-N1)-methyltransferase TrmD [Macrococcus canis]